MLGQFEALVAEIRAAAGEASHRWRRHSGSRSARQRERDYPGRPDLARLGRVSRCAEAAAARLGLPVIIENDGIAAAYGEWQFGAGRGLDNLVYVTVSTGIGGGVVLDGRLVHGRRGMAGHVGHFRLAADGPRCSCGAIGCFEALASGTELGQRARNAAADGSTDFLAAVAQRERVEGRHVVAGARVGDPTSIRLLDEEADYLGQGFASLIHLFSPDLVIMGGGVSQGFDLIEGRIHAIIARDAMMPFRAVRVVPAGLGDNSGLVGAAALAEARYGALSEGAGGR